MADLTTRYLGLELSNPIVIASCGLTKTLQGIEQCAKAGPGAIVLKSLFEEQVAAELAELTGYVDEAAHTEAYDYLQGYARDFGPRDYLELVSEAKKRVDVPIIASLNCISDDRWAEYARQLAAAGADALEINVGFLASEASLPGAAVEERHERILHAVRSQVDLPVALKVGPFFSSFAALADRLGNDRLAGPPFTVGWCGPGGIDRKVTWRGADALVLFNRFYRFDIDVDALQLVGGSPFSTADDLHLPLRWISLLAGRVNCDLAASSGVHDGRDLIKQLLAGATVAQVCSTLYRNGLEQIGVIREQLEEWMQAHGFARIDDFRGRLSQARSRTPGEHERLQYIQALVGVD